MKIHVSVGSFKKYTTTSLKAHIDQISIYMSKTI